MQLTVRDAARFLGVSEDTLQRWVQRGELPATQMNDRYRFNRVELLEWAAQRKIPVAPEILEEPGAPSRSLPRLSEALRAGGLHYRVPGSDAAGILRAVVGLLPAPSGADRELLYQLLLAREKLGSTGLGNGIAIPHPRDPIVLRVERPIVSACFLETPVDFAALDQKPVHTLFVMVTPSVRMHLHLLAVLAAVLRDPAVPLRLAARAPAEEILAEIERVEAAQAQRRAEGLARGGRA
jgi:PTS system nitrogen regulatory IIA component